jgi:hypothetical protein
MKHMNLYWFAFAIAFLTTSPVLAQRDAGDALVLRGKVRDIKIVSNDPHHVGLEVAVDIEFVNTGTKPIIFLKPQNEREAEIFWPGAISLSLAKFLAERGGCNSAIWVQSHLPAVSTAPEFREMAKRLDQPSPPPGLTHVLRPKESWVWQTTAFLGFYAKTMSSVYSGHDLPWGVVGKISTPLWMRLDYEVWSLNLQRADKGLRERLRKRWKNVGLLSIEPSLTTEPIELRLNAVSAAAPNNGMHPTRFSADAIRQIESPRGCVRAGDARRWAASGFIKGFTLAE